MQSTALAPLADLPDDVRRSLRAAHHVASLPAAFAAVSDPRRRRGRRYELPFLLTCLVLALLCDCNTLDAVGQWCREQRSLLARHFPHQRFHTPTGSLYRRLLPRLSAAQVEAAVAAWVQASRAQPDDEPLALDGKTVRGAATPQQPAPHLLSVSTHQSHETLVQVRVADKTNEIPVAQALLPTLPLAGRVVTADALHTQVALAQSIVDHGGTYVFCVKDNHPTLRGDLAFYFADPRATSREVRTLDRRRGRTEERILRVAPAEAALAPGASAFPALAQVACLARRVRERRGLREEVDYFITNQTPAQAPPEALLARIRGHWSIESRHWIRDVTFGEDRSRLRCGHAPQIMAALRNLALTLIRRTGTTQIAAQRRCFAYHPDRALALLYPTAQAA
jgi:predicted transposase YbfD/YdcC